jgi:hypothetical protein
MSEVEQIRRALKKARLPDWVARTEVETMIDHTGDAAVRVTVVVREGREGVVRDGELISDISRRIHLAVDAAGVQLFPYTRFVGASEAA